MKEKCMTQQEIMETIKQLAKSQGSYGRLYTQINLSPNKKKILKELEEQKFNNVIDLIFYFEC